jgi:outer membrane protein TolC
LAPLNGEVYTGYRHSHGNLPLYENEFQTQKGGEAHVGMIFSLVRNREIDERRFKVQDAEFEQTLAGVDLILTQLTTQLKAQHAYGEWVAAGHIFKVYEDLLTLAKERQTNLVARIKAGDAPAIMAVENKQNLLKRKALLNEAELHFIKRSNDLSLFWRDEKGDPCVPTLKNLPTHFPSLKIPTLQEVEEDITRVLEKRPELQLLQVQMQQQRNRVRLGENTLLPKIDVGLEVDYTPRNTPGRSQEPETIGLVKLSVPLHTNLGEGQIAAAQAHLRRLHQEQRLITDTIRTELHNLAAELKVSHDNLDLSHEEVSLAEKMQNAERQLLFNGASNMFLLNSREEKTAEAKVKNILCNMYMFKALGSYHTATLQFEKMNLSPEENKSLKN